MIHQTMIPSLTLVKAKRLDQYKLLGEKICLCVNSKLNDILPTLNEQLPKFHTPKLVYFLNEFQHNNSGKLDRKKCIELIRK